MSDKIKDVQWEEHVAKIKNLCAFDIKSDFPYVPERFRQSDIPKDYWPIFTLAGLNGKDALKVHDQSYDTSDEKNIRFKGFTELKRLTCKYGIRAWKNFRNVAGDIVECVIDTLDGGVTMESIDRLPPLLIDELFTTIQSNIRLTDEELLGLKY